MDAKQNKNYVVPIAMMFLLFFIISFVTGLQNPMGVIVKDQFHLSNFESQLGNMAVFLAYLFMGMPAGILLEKIGYKKTALASLVVGLLGVLVMYLGGTNINFPIYLTGAFISGFSMCMLNTVVNPLLSALGSPETANQRLNFGGAINSIGATLAPILGGMIMGTAAGVTATVDDAKPLMFVAMGIFALVFIVLSLVQIPEPHIINKEEAKIKDPNSALSFRHFKLGMLGVFIYVGIEVMIANITNLYMTNGLSIDKGVAGSIIGGYWFLMLIGRLAGGALGKKYTSKQMLTVVSSVAIIFIILAILLGASLPISLPFVNATIPLGICLLILCGLCTSVMWAGVFNLATAGLGKYTAKGSGLFMMMVFGGGVLPMLQGLVADHIGYRFSYIVTIACLAYILYYAVIGCKNVNKEIKVD